MTRPVGVVHLNTSSLDPLCHVVRPRFIGPQADAAGRPGLHDDEARIYTTTRDQTLVTCTACLVFLDACDSVGVKRDRIWIGTGSDGSTRYATTKGAFKTSKKSRIKFTDLRRGLQVNNRSLLHHLQAVRAALSISA